MKKKMFGKVLVLGLVILIVAVGVNPVVSVPMVVPKEASDVTLVEKDRLFDGDVGSSEEREIIVVRLCQDDSIKSVRERISVKEYNEYVEKIKASESLDDTFTVLKEYGIVPESMSLSHFVQVMNNKMEKFGFLKNVLGRLKETTYTTSHNKNFQPGYNVGCWFTVAIWEFNSIVRNFYFPAVICYAISEYGGSITACGGSHQCISGDDSDILMILYLGTLDMDPYMDFDGASFAGFAVYFNAWVYTGYPD